MSAKAIAFHDELSRARVVAAERRKALEEAPEITREEILAAFKHDLLSVQAPSFGRVYYYPMTAAEDFELRESIGESGETTVGKMAQVIIARARRSDGSKLFLPEDAELLTKAPPSDFYLLASALSGTSVVSAEKK